MRDSYWKGVEFILEGVELILEMIALIERGGAHVYEIFYTNFFLLKYFQLEYFPTYSIIFSLVMIFFFPSKGCPYIGFLAASSGLVPIEVGITCVAISEP